MKKIIIILTLFTSISSFAMTKLECYEEYHSKIEKIDTSIIGAYNIMFEAESTILDQYFYPHNYTEGPEIAYKHNRKNALLQMRNKIKYRIDEQSMISQELSRELTHCLKFSE